MTDARSNLTVITHPLIQHKLTLMRDKTTSSAQFRLLLKEIGSLLAYEALRDLPTVMTEVETPVAMTHQPILEGKKLCLISVLRAGNGLLDGMLDVVPTARVGHIGLYRDPQSLAAVEYFSKLPEDLPNRRIVVLDPMLATGNTSVAAIDRIKARGGNNIKLCCLLTVPEGISRVYEAHPDVPVFAAAMDEKLNDHGYIVPGIGDAGDRLFGTK